LDCPNCGCSTNVCLVEHDDERQIVECPCCETLWIASGDGLDQILVGPEG